MFACGLSANEAPAALAVIKDAVTNADLDAVVHITGKEIDDLKVAFNLAD